MERQPPVFIVGPTTRCGSTLLQRLLNSTRDIIVYGENFYVFHDLPKMIGGLHVNNHRARAAIVKATMQHFMSSEEDFEATNLFPDLDEYLKVVRRSYYAHIAFYHDYTHDLGFRRWGMKLQMADPIGFQHLQMMLPDARYVCIYRDLYPVTKSAKSRWPDDYRNLRDYTNFGRRWKANTETMLASKAKHKLIFRYEDFIAEPDRHIDELERFVGTNRIKRDVMNRKINRQPTAVHYGPLPTIEETDVYVEPADLDAAETEALFAGCRDFHAGLGYTPPPQLTDTELGAG